MADAPSHPAHALLARAQPADQAALNFKEKVQHRPLFLRPTSPDPLSSDARAARRRQRLHKKAYQLRKQKPRRLSAKDRRKLGVHDVPSDPKMRQWQLYVPLRRMWWGYMQELLGIQPGSGEQDRTSPYDRGTVYVTAAAVGPKLASADYHGAELEVVRSNCVSRVGVKGIVLKDTKFTFEIVTPSNEIKTIPKNHTVFRFEVPRCDLGPMPVGPVTYSDTEPKTLTQANLKNSTPKESASSPQQGTNDEPFVFELHGTQFEIRAVDRATKKFKSRRMYDL